MNALLNGQLLQREEAQALQNRGFRYGDGCFETMLVHEGSCPLLLLHEARIKKSLSLLGMHWPEHLQLTEQLKQLCGATAGWQKVRLWIWRAGAGLYTPETTEASTLLSTEASQGPTLHLRQQAAFSEDVVLCPSSWSSIKSISALPYVMAAREKQRIAADELLLLNYRGEVTEASSANVFFKKRKRWYTPALSTGCVAGVMRVWLMQQLLHKGEPVFEVHALAEELQRVDKLVCTNVSGLYPIAQLQDKAYDTDVEELRQLLPAEYQ